MATEPLRHLLIPKEFRVWCRPTVPPGKFAVTKYPSKATCANCLTAYRATTKGNRKPFRVSHVAAERKFDVDPWADWKNKPNENPE